MPISIDPHMLRRLALDGLDPDALSVLRNLFVVGALHKLWRNGPIEDVHASKGGPSDGQMLRMNTYMTFRIQAIFDRWIESSQVSSLDDLTVAQLEVLMTGLEELLESTAAKVAPDTTLGAVAGEWVFEVIQNARDKTYAAKMLGTEIGAAPVIYAWVLEGRTHRDLWGTPEWPLIVTKFLKVLDEPDDAFWNGRYESRTASIDADGRLQLERLLRDRPWDMTTDVADAAVYAGIGFIRP